MDGITKGTIDWARLIDLGIQYSVKVIGAIVLLAVTFLLAKKLQKITRASLHRARVEDMLARFVGQLVKWTIIAVGVISILGLFGVQTASFAAVLAASGLAVGLAFQGTLSNFAAGVMLLIFRPFRTGQVISVAGVTGTVFELDLFTTQLDTPDNRRIIIPNSAVFGATIENFTSHPTRRVDLDVGTSYDADIETTRTTLLNALKPIDTILSVPAPAAVLTSLGDNAIQWQVRVWVETEKYWETRERAFVAIKNALDQEDIGIPFPQMQLHLPKDAILQAAKKQLMEEGATAH